MLGARLGAGREADVHAWGDDAVVKLYRHGVGGHRAEALALAELDGQGVAPKLIDTVFRDGRTGLVMERLDGTDMLSVLQQRPWRVLGVARTLADVHLTVHRVEAPAALPGVRELLAARIDDAALPSRLRSHALRVLEGLPDGVSLCHGDFHPGNVLMIQDRVAVIDWPGAARGVPEADHARTRLLLRWADPLPGTSLLSRAVMTGGRSAFADSYERAYRHGMSARSPRSDPWLIVHAAARLAEGIDDEHPRLLTFLSRNAQTEGG